MLYFGKYRAWTWSGTGIGLGYGPDWAGLETGVYWGMYRDLIGQAQVQWLDLSRYRA